MKSAKMVTVDEHSLTSNNNSQSENDADLLNPATLSGLSAEIIVHIASFIPTNAKISLSETDSKNNQIMKGNFSDEISKEKDKVKKRFFTLFDNEVKEANHMPQGWLLPFGEKTIKDKTINDLEKQLTKLKIYGPEWANHEDEERKWENLTKLYLTLLEYIVIFNRKYMDLNCDAMTHHLSAKFHMLSFLSQDNKKEAFRFSHLCDVRKQLETENLRPAFKLAIVKNKVEDIIKTTLEGSSTLPAAQQKHLKVLSDISGQLNTLIKSHKNKKSAPGKGSI